jgi:nucleotide-binding universal stress UspA family protein
MYRSIIVPVDGSARSQAALPAAAALAHAAGATLDLARVHLEERPDLADDPSWDQMFREGEMRYLEALALAYEPVAGTKVTASLLDPPVAKSLLEFAETRAAPLFVMIGRGRTGLRRALLGSTCDALIRGGDTPVLVLRDCSPDDVPSWQFGRRPFRRIVLPLDGTMHAEGGIAHAVAMARAMDAKLRLVRVVGPVVTSAVLGAMAMHPMVPYDDGTIVRNDIAQEYLQGIVDRINAGGPPLDVGTEVALGTDPATAIIESCRRMSADLVVLPTHGRGASRIIVSAVGDRLLRDGPDAMLFVKPAKRRLPAGLVETTSAVKGGRVPVVAK